MPPPDKHNEHAPLEQVEEKLKPVYKKKVQRRECKCGTEFIAVNNRNKLCMDCMIATPGKILHMKDDVLVQNFMAATPEQKAEILARVEHNQERFARLIKMEAVREWLVNGNEKIGALIIGKVMPDIQKIEETKGIDKETRELIKDMSKEQKVKELSEYLGELQGQVVPPDFSITGGKE